MKKQWFELEVWLPGRGPLRTVAPGETVEEAKAYVKKRYRGSIAFSVEQAVKPRLARSKNGAEKDARAMVRRSQQESRS
jgi:hypothetical protein